MELLVGGENKLLLENRTLSFDLIAWQYLWMVVFGMVAVVIAECQRQG